MRAVKSSAAAVELSDVRPSFLQAEELLQLQEDAAGPEAEQHEQLKAQMKQMQIQMQQQMQAQMKQMKQQMQQQMQAQSQQREETQSQRMQQMEEERLRKEAAMHEEMEALRRQLKAKTSAKEEEGAAVEPSATVETEKEPNDEHNKKQMVSKAVELGVGVGELEASHSSGPVCNAQPMLLEKGKYCSNQNLPLLVMTLSDQNLRHNGCFDCITIV